MQEGRPSFTSMVVAAIRAVYTELPEPIGVARDPVAATILPRTMALPSRLAKLAASKSAAQKLHRGLGALSLGMTYHVALRTRAIDDALREALKLGAIQLVVLGAGLDARAYRMGELESTVVFEVDHPSTQRDKRARLERSGHRPLARRLEMVSVDFERDDLLESLGNAGFSSDAPSFWIWEGVTVYLSKAAMTGTLQAIAKTSAPGSRVAITYAEPRPNDFERALIAVGAVAIRLIGEPITGFISAQEMASLADQSGFAVVSDEAASDWSARYWSGEPVGPFEWERLVVLERSGGSA